MNYYWAKFRNIGANMYRLDTRVYLKSLDKPGDADFCLGAIIGKNPGSAAPHGARGKMAPVSLDGDKCLPTIRSILTKAYDSAGENLPDRSFVQVLNLFYICDPNLPTAIKALQAAPRQVLCIGEGRTFPWAWYMWGGDNRKLNGLKSRFSQLQANTHFYYDLQRKAVVVGRPDKSITAKHTQGLPHEPLVEYLAAAILK